jgi:[amino group carrier protein]-lysine/ornithine hydrolase
MVDNIALLTGLLEHYSPTGEEAGAVAYLVASMNALGFSAHVDPIGNAVGTMGSGQREIVLLGHIDTVPGFIPVRQKNQYIYGRGAVDAKGPLASFVAAAARAQISADWRVTVIGAVGEEGNSRGAKYLCETYPAPEMCVIGEPSGWDHVTLGYKGSLWFSYSVCQGLIHTAARGTGACERAFGFWTRLTQAAASFNEGKERVFDQLTPSLREMQSEMDGFSDAATLKVNLRIPPGLDLSQVRALLEEVAREPELSGEVRLDIVEDDFSPAYRAEKNTSLVRAFLAGIRGVGGQPGFTLKSGTADMNTVGPVWNCPIMAYGPGDSSLDHTPEEHILEPEYLSGIQVLVKALEKLVG